MKENRYYLERPDSTIYYERWGKGKPILFLHGNGEDLSIFQTVYPYFEDEFEIIAMDTRGHGKSDLGGNPLTFQKIAEDIEKLLSDCGIDKVHLIGYSDGGNLALYFASRFPEKVSSVIAMGANFAEEGLLENTQKEIRTEKETILNLPESPEKNRRLQVHNLMMEELKLQAADLAGIAVPVLIMAGEDDVVKRAHTLEMTRLLPNARCSIVPGGHDFFVKQPELLAEAAAEFYQEIDEGER